MQSACNARPGQPIFKRVGLAPPAGRGRKEPYPGLNPFTSRTSRFLATDIVTVGKRTVCLKQRVVILCSQVPHAKHAGGDYLNAACRARCEDTVVPAPSPGIAG